MEKSINVLKFAEARASEISSLIEEVNNLKGKTAFQRLPPHLRRRAASHNPKRVPRKLREAYLIQNPHAISKPKKASRKVHRQQQKKKHKKQAKNYHEEYAARSKPGSIWLGTHIWHVKRCKMKTLWGYRLAMHCCDRKLGATHQALTKGAMLQDLSYYCCIDLKGPQQQLLNGLSNLVDPETGFHFGSEIYLDGDIEGHTFIYHPKKFPLGAIGPVTFIWEFRSISMITKDQNRSNDIRTLWIWCHPSFHDELVQTLVELFQLKENVCKLEDSLKSEVMNKKHEEMFASKVNFVKVKQHFQKNICYENGNIIMVLLKDKLVRHRIIGPEAQNLLTNVIELADVELKEIDSCNNALKNSPHLEKSTHDARIKKSKKHNLDSDDEKTNPPKKLKLDLDSAIKSPTSRHKFLKNKRPDVTVPDHMFVKSTMKSLHNDKKSLTEEENRKNSDKTCENQRSFQPWWNTYYKHENIKHSHTEKKKLLEWLRNENSGYNIPPGTIISFTVRDPRLLLNQNKQQFTSKKETSDISKTIEEHLGAAAIYSPIWNENIRDEVTATQLAEHVINKERSTYVISSESLNLGDVESRIPILLVHLPSSNGFGSGWDLIAPLGWSMAFWIPLTLNGGRATGLRDLNFINLEMGIPNFPISYPDTKAGATFEEIQRMENLITCYKRPKAKQPNFKHFGVPNPFFMPWEILVKNWLKEDYSFLPNISCEKNSEAAKINFFVCRQYKLIWQLNKLCGQLSTVSTKSKTTEMARYKQIFYDIVSSTLMSHKHFFNALILIRLKCLTKGCPTINSGIYALSDSDFQELKQDRNFLGPVESEHTNCNQCESPSDIIAKSVANNETDSKRTDRPLVKSLQTCSSRKMIGYLSEGGFSSIMAKGCALGHCSFVALLVSLMNCLNAGMRPLVLIRKQDSFQYRVMSIEVVNYF